MRCLLLLAPFIMCMNHVLAANSAADGNLYETLGITQTATTKEITRAYRKLALKYHPDKNTDGDKAKMEETFTAIVNAYEILKDDESRAKYDAGQLSDSETHRYRDFRSAAAAAGMGQVQDTPFAWLGIALSILAAAAPAAYVAIKQSNAKRSKPKPMSAADAALRALSADEEGASAAAAADATRDAAAASVKQAAAARRAQNKAAAQAAADAQSAAQRRAHLEHVSCSSGTASNAQTSSTPTPDRTPEVTPEVLSQLSKALSKYPGGTRDRFQRVAEYMGGGMAESDVKALVAALRRRNAPSPGAAQAAESPHPEQPQGASRSAAWSQDEQRSLEAALTAWAQRPAEAAAGASDKAARKAAAAAKWRWVAAQPGLAQRSAAQCLARYKECAKAIS